MSDTVQKVNYCYVTTSARAGSGAKVLGALKDAGVNMLAFTGFPAGAGKAQLDIIVDKPAPVQRLARANGWRVSPTKKAFLIRGGDRPGAVLSHVEKLADARVNVTAANAVTTEDGRYAMILWVKPKDYNRAARVLGAK